MIFFLYIFNCFGHITIGWNMEKKLYNKIVMNHKPKEKRLQNAIISFIIGGILGVIGEGLLELYEYYLNISQSDAASFMIISLILLVILHHQTIKHLYRSYNDIKIKFLNKCECLSIILIH